MMQSLASIAGSSRIARIEWARLVGRRPRMAGCNARLAVHGIEVRPPIARITTSDGATGWGRAQLTQEQAFQFIGRPLRDAFTDSARIAPEFVALEYPLLDLAGKLAGLPVYALVSGGSPAGRPLRVPCYDTSLYIDDLHLADDAAAAALIAAEAREGYERGHRAFKIKVGRGAMHMPLEEGTRRDVAVVSAVREAVGPEATILLDANNGYNFNLTRRVLAETAAARPFWMEEPFHEDGELYRRLKDWMAGEGLAVLIADGEGLASPRLLDWAQQGLVDVIQYDIFSPGFSRWLELGPQLDAWNVRTAPHHYGGFYGNYASPHLAAVIRQFAFVEWDEATVPGIETSRYRIVEGRVEVPDAPGFGLELDEELFARAVRGGGFIVEA